MPIYNPISNDKIHDGETDTVANLPPASSHNGEIFIVTTPTGWWPTKKAAGLYVSNGSIWSRMGIIQGLLKASDVINDVTSTDINKPLSALQGKTLQDIKQGLDSDLTSISELSPSNDEILQRKAGEWTNSTPSTIKTDLALVKGDVGLANVSNVDQQNASNITSGTVSDDRLSNAVTLHTDSPSSICFNAEGTTQGGTSGNSTTYSSEYVIFSTEVHDIGDNYDVTTGEFTATKDGYYSFAINVLADVSIYTYSSGTVDLYINGVNMQSSTGDGGTLTRTLINLSSVRYLSIDDVVRVRLNSYYAQIYTSPNSNFSGFFLGE